MRRLLSMAYSARNRNETALRAESSFSSNNIMPLSNSIISLSPGQKLLIPTRITLVPADDFKDLFGYPKRSAEVFKKVGSNGFSGEPEHGMPAFRSLEYGRSLRVAGVSIDGNRIEFQQRSANFVDVVLGWGQYSCPYLLSWDNTTEQWINHGKILHDAKSRHRQYTEVTTFPGLRTRFSLEEREEETAFINRAELIVKLLTGNTLSLQPKVRKVTTRDGERAVLKWGYTIILEFVLPESVAASAVINRSLW